jgi:uncharacterized protein
MDKIAKTREDEYFAREEFERIRKIAEENAAQMRKQEIEELRQLHWMRCPKDGMELAEIEYAGVKVDKCTHCGGIYLDPGELETLLAKNEQQDGMLGKILNVFR